MACRTAVGKTGLWQGREPPYVWGSRSCNMCTPPAAGLWLVVGVLKFTTVYTTHNIVCCTLLSWWMHIRICTMSTHDSMRLRSPEEDLGLTAGEIRAFQNMSEDPTVGAYPVDPPTCSTTRRLLDGQHVIPGIGARGLLVCEQIKKNAWCM